MHRDKPGIVECRVDSSGNAYTEDLHRGFDGLKTTEYKARILVGCKEALAKPQINPEKIRDIHANIRPFVPEGLQDNVLYIKPTEEEEEYARSVKKTRKDNRKKQSNKRISIW